MSLDGLIGLVALVIVLWHVIRGIAWVVERTARGQLHRRLRRASSPWADGDVDDAAEFGIDLTRVADDPHTGGAR